MSPQYVLALLLGVNLVNYLDRQILYSLLPLIQADLGITDAQAGRLASAFMFVYMLAAPPIGYWADKSGRKFWITLGVALWSIATAASGMARSYASLFVSRAAVGIGESCYGAISPSFVAEHFPSSQRGSVLALFSMAIPVGSALGYIIGGSIGQLWGWRNAFLIVGLPGLILAVLTTQLRDPEMYRTKPKEELSALSHYKKLFHIPSYCLVTLAGAAMTFALGGLAVWMPTFFHRNWGMGVGRAGTIFGAITVLAGILGSLSGGWISDRLLRYTRNSYFLISGLGLLIGMPLAIYSLSTRNVNNAMISIFFAEFFLFLNMGPLNAIIVSVTELNSRSMAFAANIFFIHALGDAISPAIVGSLSDHFGLKAALIAASLTLGPAGSFCLWGMRYYNYDTGRIQNA